MTTACREHGSEKAWISYFKVNQQNGGTNTMTTTNKISPYREGPEDLVRYEKHSIIKSVKLHSSLVLDGTFWTTVTIGKGILAATCFCGAGISRAYKAVAAFRWLSMSLKWMFKWSTCWIWLPVLWLWTVGFRKNGGKLFEDSDHYERLSKDLVRRCKKYNKENFDDYHLVPLVNYQELASFGAAISIVFDFGLVLTFSLLAILL